MSTAAQGAYDSQGWNTRPWGSPPGWTGPWWRGGPLWIAAVVAAFMIWWPLGVGLLAFLIGSGRMGCKGRAFRARPWGAPGVGCGPWSAWRNFCGEHPSQSSGNRAFDEYRAETLRRLDEEQRRACRQTGAVTLPSKYDPNGYTHWLPLFEDGRRHLVMAEEIPLACPVRLRAFASISWIS